MPPEVSSSSQVIVNKAFEEPSIVDAKSLVECQLATAAFSSKLLVLSANNGPSVCIIKNMLGLLYRWAHTARVYDILKQILLFFVFFYAIVRACIYKNVDSRDAIYFIGLHVVLGAVYNHLHGNGPFDENYVLDNSNHAFLTVLVACIISKTLPGTGTILQHWPVMAAPPAIIVMSADEAVENSFYETSTGCFTVPSRNTCVCGVSDIQKLVGMERNKNSTGLNNRIS
ncbi:hypothetical protein NC651_019520 [Populus alba x Populus x berolinensis]|nr:hypothetical protein NC651_019520 [Populus alba x Populus x berolinensis]